MKNLFSLLDVEFALCKNKQWVENKISQINDCISNNLFCIVVEYKYGDFRDVSTYIFSNKNEMEEFKTIPAGESSKWIGKYFYSDGFECRQNIDC